MAVTKKTSKISKRAPKASAKKTPGKAVQEKPSQVDRLPNARTRLKALKARRANLQSTPSPATPVEEPAAGGAGLAALLGGGAPTKLHGKILMQIYGILTQSSGSDTKMVPGTQFSEQGVQDLMNKLHKRAADENQKGAKIAGMLLKFLTAKEGEKDVIAGASGDKLRVLSGAANRVVKGK